MKCRHCASILELPFLDLGSMPCSNAYLNEQSLATTEKMFPLRVWVCKRCWLAQTEDFVRTSELFDSQYAYFSGFSSSWLAHCERYVADMVARFGLTRNSHVVEIAANDGYLLQYVKIRDISCTGVEPTASTAAAARAKGISIVEDFFGVRLAKLMVAQGKQADLAIANNVLAHVPDINDFVAGFALLLKPQGVGTFEFPHLLNLITQNQFDTVYHEHFSYLSMTAVNTIFSANGLTVFDVETLPTHGGSLRVYAQRSDTGNKKSEERVGRLIAVELDAGMTKNSFYADFQAKADGVKNNFFSFLTQAKKSGKKCAAYGAAAKGNTLLNFAGIHKDLLPYIVDKNPAKQNKWMPGSRIPIVAETVLKENRPDYVIILPWNLRDEVIGQLSYVRKWGGKFVTAVPNLVVT
ncbi:MAG: class I SAM-dependent methyltransferase [Candidatus Omnitrophota bacterium]